MTDFIFPDNSVLCSFAAVDELITIEGWLRGRGAWTDAVEREVQDSQVFLPPLRSVLTDCWLGDPIEAEEDEEEEIARTRRVVFGGTDDRPREHLGEATTLTIIRRRARFSGSIWLSDDQDSLRYAKLQGIQCMDTCDILGHVVADGDLTRQLAHSLLVRMASLDRGVRVPASSDYFS